ncbi:uncharacterized protein LOC119306032 [Triticum dicoccoides]|uniref:uncharacterized protein LOC119306032 n=1 Tax=Triticum dicoccoides TaxID=85692 RepID=UPI000E7B2A73|nr:uncharacterized protein LOC119306032 [Triticum dicoccoides]
MIFLPSHSQRECQRTQRRHILRQQLTYRTRRLCSWVSMLNGDTDGCPSSTNKLEIPSPAEITSRVERESTPSRQNIGGAIQELKTTVISLFTKYCYFLYLRPNQALAELEPSSANKGHRVLIVSHWTPMVDILQWTLEVI